MVTFGDLKEGGYFYYLREDARATAYKIREISDHGSYIGIAGDSCDPSKPNRGFHIDKDKFDTSVMDDGERSYYSDVVEAEKVIRSIVRKRQAAADEAKSNLITFLQTVKELNV